MGYLLLAAAAVFVLIVAESRKTASTALPAVLPSTGPTTNAGESASTQELTSGAGTATTVASDAATGNIAGAVAAGVSGLLTQLTQHSQRLSDAKAENSAIPQAVEAFDADMASISAAYCSGQITPAQVAGAVLVLDQNIYNYLHGLVGKPGTAWPATQPAPTSSAPPPGAGIACNTACTASCCLFYDDLNPPIVAIFQAMQGEIPTGGGYAPETGGFQITFPEVYPPDDPAYGDYQRASYTLPFVKQNSAPASLLASVI